MVGFRGGGGAGPPPPDQIRWPFPSSCRGRQEPWSLVRREARACRVAFTTLAWLEEPEWDLATMSRTPAASSTARMVLPAIRPVPGGGGLQKHLAAAEFGVDFMRNRAVGDGDRAKLALGGFRSLADGVCHFIGLAEAEAYAGLPWSPLTTRAEKEKRRPPLTTLAQRLMNTTFSASWGPSSTGASA